MFNKADIVFKWKMHVMCWICANSANKYYICTIYMKCEHIFDKGTEAVTQNDESFHYIRRSNDDWLPVWEVLQCLFTYIKSVEKETKLYHSQALEAKRVGHLKEPCPRGRVKLRKSRPNRHNSPQAYFLIQVVVNTYVHKTQNNVYSKSGISLFIKFFLHFLKSILYTYILLVCWLTSKF